MQALLQFFEPVQRNPEPWLERLFGGFAGRSHHQKLFAVWRDVVWPDVMACVRDDSDGKLHGAGDP
jgi:hypothetical protein